MSGHDDDPLTARLASQRLAMPGVLDRTPIERSYERLQQGRVTHELTERLHQRATASGEAGASAFVWRRSAAPADASVEGLRVPGLTTSVPTAAPRVAAASSMTVSRVNSPVVQRATLPDADAAPALTARLASRAQSPGVLTVSRPIARAASANSVNNAPAFAADLQSRYGVTSNEAATTAAPLPATAALSISPAPAGVVRRQADASTPALPRSNQTGPGAVPMSGRASHGTAAAATPALQAPTATTAMASTLPLAAMSSLAPPDSPTADSARIAGTPMLPAARPLLSTASAAGAPLVLRRMLAAPAQASTPVAAVLPPGVIQLPREETPAPAPQKLARPVAKSAGTHTDPDIDRITEEVGRRLMRRLQIERERRGIRQWR